jgi:hypothetical protein
MAFTLLDKSRVGKSFFSKQSVDAVSACKSVPYLTSAKATAFLVVVGDIQNRLCDVLENCIHQDKK